MNRAGTHTPVRSRHRSGHRSRGRPAAWTCPVTSGSRRSASCASSDMRDRLGARAGGGGAASPTLGQFQNATLSLGTWPVALASPSGSGSCVARVRAPCVTCGCGAPAAWPWAWLERGRFVVCSDSRSWTHVAQQQRRPATSRQAGFELAAREEGMTATASLRPASAGQLRRGPLIVRQ